MQLQTEIALRLVGFSNDNDRLIDQATGDLNIHEIDRRARRIAGGDKASPREVRYRAETLREQALVLRRRWRADRGLPDDTTCTMVEVPTWGASGDGFGREVL